MSSDIKDVEETRKALIRAIEEHFAAVAATEEDPDDRNRGILMSWTIFVEFLTPHSGPTGQSTFDLTYATSDSSPAQVVGVAKIGLRRLEQDLSPM